MLSILLSQYVHGMSLQSEGENSCHVATVLFLVSNILLLVVHLRLICTPLLIQLRGVGTVMIARIRGLQESPSSASDTCTESDNEVAISFDNPVADRDATHNKNDSTNVPNLVNKDADHIRTPTGKQSQNTIE